VNFIVGVNTRLGNAPRSRIRGIEVETVIAASDDVQFNLDFSYLDARYRELTSSGIDLAGNYLPFAPKFQGNISADFTLLRPGGDHRVVFTPSAHYVSRSYFSPFNEENGYDINQQEGNIKVNAQIAYEMGDFALRGWVKNLFNEKTHSYGVNLTDGFGYHYMLPAPPRTYGVSARYRF
jgi:outer membrane receptor protein involved in Fe transport